MSPNRTLAVLALAAATAVSSRAGLLSLWTFDETSGTVAHDSAGSVDGNLAGSAAWAPGQGVNGSGAIRLSQATGDYVDMGDVYNFSSAFSIQAWVKLESGDTGGFAVVARHHAGTAAGYFLALNDTGDGCSAVGTAHFYAGYPCSGVSGGGFNDGNWHQIVGTFSGGVASIYIDGQLQASSNGSTGLTQISAPFVVGGLLNVPGTAVYNTFNGLVDNVGVWDSALTGSEVQSLYGAAQTPEPATGLLLLVGAVGCAFVASKRKTGIQNRPTPRS
jgi:hypothetical protein